MAAMWELDYLEQCGNSNKEFEMVSSSLVLIHVIICCVAISVSVVGLSHYRLAQEDQMVVWVVTGTLLIGIEEIYKFVVLHAEYLLFLYKTLFC